jgi:hypothetical protein
MIPPISADGKPLDIVGAEGATLVAVPADNAAAVRSLSATDPSLVVRDIRARMAARQLMSDRMSEPSTIRDTKARMAARHRMIGRLDDE